MSKIGKERKNISGLKKINCATGEVQEIFLFTFFLSFNEIFNFHF